MYFNILKAKYISAYKLELFFKNGENGIVDLKIYIQNGKVFNRLNNLEIFKVFNVEYGTVSWCNSEIDIAPEKLYELATGKNVEFKIDSSLKTA